jgi:hypothetical protein
MAIEDCGAGGAELRAAGEILGLGEEERFAWDANAPHPHSTSEAAELVQSLPNSYKLLVAHAGRVSSVCLLMDAAETGLSARQTEMLHLKN